MSGMDPTRLLHAPHVLVLDPQTACGWTRDGATHLPDIGFPWHPRTSGSVPVTETAAHVLSWSCFSTCWCRANRPLPLPDGLADMLLRVLQEFVGPVQDFPAAV